MKKYLAVMMGMMVSASVYAQEAATAVAGDEASKEAAAEAAKAAALAVIRNSGSTGMIALAAGVAISIAVLGGTIGQGLAASAALEGVSRNPAATDKIFTPFILSLALIESLVILAFLVSFVKIGGLL